MSQPPIELLVLDAHGVVLNNPLAAFLDVVESRTGQAAGSLRSRWQRELRLPAWTGGIDDEDLWAQLTRGEGEASEWRLHLEAHYAVGPVFPHLGAWRQCAPLWILSNHRTAWLEARLDRFGLRDLFDRVLVSDRIGAAKPDPAAFAPLLEGGRDPESILFLDDKECNVRAARALGMRAVQVADDARWQAAVRQLLVPHSLAEADRSR